MTMNRWRDSLLVVVTLVIAGCGAAASTTSAPLPTLPSTTEQASQAPPGAIPIKLATPNGQPRFEPDHVAAKAGTLVFFLDNVSDSPFYLTHNMQIGPTLGQVLAGTPAVRAKEMMTFTVNGLTPGTYVFWCSVVTPDFKDHASYGMVGTLTVTP